MSSDWREGLSYSQIADVLLAQTGMADVDQTVLAGTIGVIIQAFVVGSVLQLVHRYFIRHGNDPPLARAGVVWMTALVMLHVVCANVINGRLIMMSDSFTAGYLMDFWLAQLSNLIFTIVLLPVFLFFAFRAWNLWARRKIVMAVCLAAITPAVVLGVAAAAMGLQHPYPLKEIDNAAFQAWIPFFQMTVKKMEWIALTSSICQFISACIFCALICTGLFFHRTCCNLMPNLAGKINFVFGESLLPLVLVSGIVLAGDILTKTYQSSLGPLLSRAVHACAPAIYFHCLMTSLCSPQRHRDQIRAEVEAMAEDGHVNEKDPYSNAPGEAFNPAYHPEDLDTPLQIEVQTSGAGVTRFSAEGPGLELERRLTPIITRTRNSITGLTSPFRKLTGRSYNTPISPVHSIGGVHTSPKTRTSPIGASDEQLASAGAGRRSSLASVADHSPGGLSIKMNHKLPSLSFKPNFNRRESESIFVAHEEFDGLPVTPGDELGAIEEGASDVGTPSFFTPRLEGSAVVPSPQRALSPAPVSPRPSHEADVTRAQWERV